MLNLIIPMAGKGTRMLPHTLTTLKPMFPIVGKPIIQRLLKEIRNLYKEPIRNIGFIVKGLSNTIQSKLECMASEIGAKSHFFEQNEAMGTAHAIACAHSLLKGPILIAYPDTLFRNIIPLDVSQDAIILVHTVQEPSAFGVVQLDDNNFITNFIEKPTKFISNLAIIGLYYFKQGEKLKHAIQSIIDQGIRKSGEYHLTDALEYLQKQGTQFYAHQVEEWLDCGNKQATLHTNKRFLSFLQEKKDLISTTAQIYTSNIIPPVYLGENVNINNAIIGPYVSVGDNTHIIDSCIKNSIIQTNSTINQVNINNSIIGNYSSIKGTTKEMSIGDYNSVLV